MGFRDRLQSRWDARAVGSGLAPGGGGGPLTVLSEVFVERSAQAIWDARRDVALMQLVSPCMVSIEPVVGTGPGVGQQMTLVHKHGDTSDFFVVEVLDEHPPAYQESRTTSAGKVPSLSRIWIEHTGAGCRVREQTELDLPRPWTTAQRVAHEASLQSLLDTNGQRWKELLETGTVGPAPPH